MKKILLSILVLFAFIIMGYSQNNGFTINGGYSWLNGVVGAEMQFGNLAISGGYYPATMPHSGESVSSYSGALTWYGENWDENCGYLSVGVASAGYREEIYGTYGTYDQKISPTTIIMAGYRYANGSGLSSKFGVGYGWCEEMNTFTFEILLGYTIPW